MKRFLFQFLLYNLLFLVVLGEILRIQVCCYLFLHIPLFQTADLPVKVGKPVFYYGILILVALGVLIERGDGLLLYQFQHIAMEVQREPSQQLSETMVEHLRVPVGAAALGGAFVIVDALLLDYISVHMLAALLALEEAL